MYQSTDERSVVSDELWRTWSSRKSRLRHEATARIVKTVAVVAGLFLACVAGVLLFAGR